jgi:hypothetical protein
MEHPLPGPLRRPAQTAQRRSREPAPSFRTAKRRTTTLEGQLDAPTTVAGNLSYENAEPDRARARDGHLVLHPPAINARPCPHDTRGGAYDPGSDYQ